MLRWRESSRRQVCTGGGGGLQFPPIYHLHSRLLFRPRYRAPPPQAGDAEQILLQAVFFLILRFHSISFTRALGIPRYSIGLGRGKRWRVEEGLVEVYADGYLLHILPVSVPSETLATRRVVFCVGLLQFGGSERPRRPLSDVGRRRRRHGPRLRRPLRSVGLSERPRRLRPRYAGAPSRVGWSITGHTYVLPRRTVPQTPPVCMWIGEMLVALGGGTGCVSLKRARRLSSVPWRSSRRRCGRSGADRTSNGAPGSGYVPSHFPPREFDRTP